MKRTVLAVDDDMVILALIRKILGKEYDVCLAKSVESALTILDNTFIDIILLDMEMPVVPGMKLISQLRENACHYFCYIPIIVITSFGTKDIFVQARKAGANDFMVKPINPKILSAKMESLLGGREIPAREYVLKQLHMLGFACKSGNHLLVEKIADSMKEIKYNYGTDSKIADISKKAQNFDYPAVLSAINDILKEKLYDPFARGVSENGQENK